MNSSSVNVSDSPTPSNLFDEFEEAYQNCLSPLTKEDNLNSNTIQEELRANAEMNALKFLDLARQMEAFFLQKRYLLSVQKPEFILMEEIAEMRNEIARKDDLIKRHGEKLTHWQNQLMTLQSRSGTLPSVGSRPSLTSGPSHHMSMMGTTPTTPSPVAMSGLSPVTGTTMSSGSMGHSGPSISHSMNPNMGMTVGQSSIMGQVGGNMGTGMGSMVGMGQGGYQSNIGMPSGHSGMSSGSTGISSNMSSGGTGMPGPGGMTSGMGAAGNMTSSGGTMGMTSSSGPMQTGMNMYPGGPMSQQAHGGGLQGPLAFLEKTTTNIGMPEPRR